MIILIGFILMMVPAVSLVIETGKDDWFFGVLLACTLIGVLFLTIGIFSSNGDTGKG